VARRLSATARILRCSFTAPAWFAVALVLCGCDGQRPAAQRQPTPVLAQIASVASRDTSVSLTGQIEARVQSDLSFRFAGRIAERKVDVGDHVQAGQVLAVLETSEQLADVNSATAGVQGAEATLKQATAAFERQQALIKSGFTTQSSFDDAKQNIEAAQAALTGAKATLGTAQDALANTQLRADAQGIVIARNAEAGQVVDAAQPVYTVAQDGARDAVFDLYEALLVRPPPDTGVEIVLISDPSIKTVGKVREISPAIDPATGTVRVKVEIDDAPPEMKLGSAVIGVARFQPLDVVALPSTALSETDDKPAVWVVDPESKVASLRTVTMQSYRTGEILLRSGLRPGDIVVTGGAQLLRPGEIVAPQMTALEQSDRK
jgi:RND family efflux transporter MFP subunit